MKINKNLIIILLKANNRSPSLPTHRRVAAADPGVAKHGGNNRAGSLEVSPLSLNPRETGHAALEEMNNSQRSVSAPSRGSGVKITHR